MIHECIKVKVVLTVIVLVHIFILSKLIFFPYPELFIYPYLINQGLKPYSQILDQHFPGLMFLPVNFANLGMVDAIVARYWLMGVVIITHLLIFHISRKILASDRKAMMVNVLYLVWQPLFEGWVWWIDSLLPLFLLPAFYFTYRAVTTRESHLKFVFLAGMLLGVGVVFKQVIIPLSLLCLAYLLWEKRSAKIGISFYLGFLPPIILMLIYLWSIGVLSDFWYWSIVFNLTTFAEHGRKLPFFTGMVRVGFVLAAAVLVWFCQDKKLSRSLTIFTVGSLSAIFARFDFIHFQVALPLVIVATVVGFQAIWKKLAARLLALAYLGVASWWMIIFYQGHLSDKIFFFDSHTLTVASKIEAYTSPGDKIFIYGAIPHLYQITKTLPAGDLFVFQFPWFMMVAEDRILEGVRKDRPQLVVSDRTVEIQGQKITDFTRKIDSYIEENYLVLDKVGQTSIMQRRSP